MTTRIQLTKLPKTVSGRRLEAPGGRGRLNRKRRTTGLDVCECGLLGCYYPMPAKVQARKALGKCMGCGHEMEACACKRTGYAHEPYHFKSPEERMQEANVKKVKTIVKANKAKWAAGAHPSGQKRQGRRFLPLSQRRSNELTLTRP